MATLVLQSYQSVAHNEDETSGANLEKMLLENLGKLTTTSRYWTMFRVGKQATRLVSLFGNTVLCTNVFRIGRAVYASQNSTLSLGVAH